MSLEERAVLQAGLDWEAEQTPESGADDDDGSGVPTRSNTLNLDAMAALGAQVS